MKIQLLLAPTLILPLSAGSPDLTPPSAGPPPIRLTFDLRARMEYGSLDNPALDRATAFTLRERIGLATREWLGLSAVVEGEFTQAIGDAYDAAPTPYATQSVSPNPRNPRTQIHDPESNELNQAFLQFQHSGFTVRAGRQRLILDNAAFVGNVGWRQNEQTYDALDLKYTAIDDLSLHYTYANRANRIFGSDATNSLRSFAGDIHLFNATYQGFGDLSLTTYAYLMDFDETAANAGYVSNNTYGVIATHPAGPFTLYSEIAAQTDASSSPASKPSSTWYAHINASYKTGSQTLTFGCESLGADFVTPLATVHAFNGFADVFAAPRIGLIGNPGLNDLYLTHTTPLPFLSLAFSHSIHLFGDNNSGFNYGWEYDAVLSRKFFENFLVIAKFAIFESDDPVAANPAPYDTNRISVELNYTF